MKVDKLQALILALVICVSVATAAYAAVSVSWSATNRVRVASPSLGVYQDASLSQPASNSLDYGVLHQGDQIAQNWWIRNEGGTGLTLSWSSDLNAGSVSGYVSNTWTWFDGQNWRDLNGYNLGPGVVLATKYVVFISTLTPSGTYTWQLNLSGS